MTTICPDCSCDETIFKDNGDLHCFLCKGLPCQTCGDLSHSVCPEKNIVVEKQNTVNRCEDCHEVLLQPGQRSLTCRACGLVNEEFLLEKQWSDTQRCSAPSNAFRISGFVKNGNQKRYVNIVREEYNSRLARYNLGAHELNQLCTKAGIPKGCFTFIKYNWQKYVDMAVCHKSVKRKGVFLYCIFLGCMEAGFTRTIKEICDLCDMPLSNFRKGEKIMKEVECRRGEAEADFFYSRFIRLVQQQKMDFWLAEEMNKVFNKTKSKLACYPNDALTLAIFCFVLQIHYSFDISQISKQYKMNLAIYPEVKSIIESCLL
jgi:hypothetical protein